MKPYYKETDEVTPDGQKIYHRVAGRGRPALYVKRGDRYVAWKRPVEKKAAVAA